MGVYTLPRSQLHLFLAVLSKRSPVYVPVKRDAIRFEPYNGTIDFSDNAYFPIKEHFFRKRETILRFDGQKLITVRPTSSKKIFFGVRRCDLTALKHQDSIFQKQYKDPWYKAQRANTILIGYHCATPPNKYCFCDGMGLEEYQDLMFYEQKTQFLVEVTSVKGAALIKKYRRFFKKANKRITDADKHIKTRKLRKRDFNAIYDHHAWTAGVNKCLSCTACTAMCPTCYCYELHDELDTLKHGTRCRIWSSCQVKAFTRIAGNHVFREQREHRFKHRIYHQIQYFREQHGFDLCTGCGRCIAACPTRIDWVSIANKIT
ncbi:MAG: 4Fe-4S dicluster domain-containing protein [Nanoarchaeota archaeon]|nr:4Fe-4S dicluster domain-containing protein [Nanoarchaeota archaeon]